MNEYQAINLIKETFEKPFNKLQFTNFIINLLNLKQDEILNEHPYSGNYIPEAYRQYINSLYRIAKYEDDSGKKIDVLIVRLEKDTSLERARSMQRNFIAWYLKGSRGGILKDAALVAFVSPDNDDWRFSFVKIQYLFKDNKAEEMLSSALRYSFLVGKNEISYTAQSQLIPFLLDDKNKPTLEMLEHAFSVEKVSDKFFQDYRELYKKAMKEFENNNVFKIILEQNSNLTVDLFVRKLLGQVVFLYFLQKKGWLGIKIDEPGWKDGNRKFLIWTFEDCKKKNKNYFDRFLQPLFYTGFNKKEELFQYDEFQFKIPFLNGGLFEELFHWESTFINPANTLFSNNEIHKDGSIGTGILDIFDRYNFTIDENTAFEKEIAVDPEMLGKVFENLLPENLRKGKGTYYTPREIVAYMTKESLVNYLTSKITPVDSDKLPKTEVKIRRLFDYKDLYINKINKEIKKHGKEFEQQFYEMLDIVESVNKHLQAIKIVDPACGSGAFPMGILLEIVSLREYIENEFLDNKISNYKLKKETIQNSIYGVDIDPGAVEIAKLRFWLSLVVDAEKPEPLPNLDYKIMQGNSLIESFEGIDLSRVMSDNYYEITLVNSQMDFLKDNANQQKFVFSDKRKETIISLKNQYYLETDPIQKKEIHQKIDKIVLEHIYFNLETEKDQLQLTMVELKNNLKNRIKRLHNFSQLKQLLKTDKKAKQIREIKKEIFEIDKKFIKLKELEKSIERPYFLWHLFFSEIFEKENEGFDIVIANPPYGATIDEQTDVFARLFPKTTKAFKDIYKIFVNKSLSDLIRENGVLTFILPNTFLLQPRYKDLRQFLLDFNIKVLLNLGENVFKAIVPTAILIVQKSKNEENLIKFGDLSKNSKFEGINLHLLNFISINQLMYNESNSNIFISSIRTKQTNEEFLEDVIKLKDAGINYQRVKVGLGAKGKSDLGKRLLYSGRKENEEDVEFWKGEDIDAYYIKKKTDKFVRLKMIKTLKFNERVILNKEYFSLKPKLLWRQTAQFPIAMIDFNGVWFGRSIQAGIIKNNWKKKIALRYILALLNSSYIRGIYVESVKELGRVFPQIKLEKLRKLPIKIIYPEQQKPFIQLVDQILSLKKAGKDTQKLEDQIDLMVYKLYGLTYDEVKIVDPEFCMSKKEYEKEKYNE